MERVAGRASLRLTRGATIDDLRLLIDAVEQELGIALVPRIAAAQAIAPLRGAGTGPAAAAAALVADAFAP